VFNTPAIMTLDIFKVGLPLWSSNQEFLATDPEVPSLIPDATRFSKK
jgi:hypothetical protein